ncbi:MAG: molybdopterin-dependent oxidoreductase [Gammaproteobacteria bacterium]
MPGRSGAMARCPARSISGTTSRQHQPPCQPPWISTKVAIVRFLAGSCRSARMAGAWYPNRQACAQQGAASVWRRFATADRMGVAMEPSGTITRHASICRFCSVGCPVSVDLRDGLPVRVNGNRNSPTYHGFCCRRGYAAADQMLHPDRLLRPLRRGADGTHVSIASTQAVDEIAARVQGLIDAHGPDCVAAYFGTYSGPYPATSALMAAWVQAIGSPMLFSSMTIDQPGKDIAAALLGGWEAGPQGFTGADVWMIIGSNPLVSIGLSMPAQNPVRRLDDAIAGGMQLIVIDPRRTETARRAQVHLQPRPGEDAAILAGMMRVILDEGLHDAAFVADWVDGLAALRRTVDPFTPAYVAGRADIPADDLVRAARIFARARRGLAAGATGANMSGHSSLVEYLIACLNTICGRYLRAGEPVANPGVLLPRATPRAQARPPRPARGLGVPMSARGLGLAASGMPTAALADEILAGRVKALFSAGGNPAAAFPDQNRTVRALEKLELFVQLDIKMSASARLAHYVLPPRIGFEVPTASLAYESIELYGSIYGLPEPFGMYAPRLVDPPAGSDLIEEWELFYDLGRRMGLPLTLHFHDTLTGPARAPRAPIALDMRRRPSTDELLELLARGSRIALDEVKKHPDGAVFHESIVTVPADPGCSARMQVGDPDMMAELAGVIDEPVVALRDPAQFPFLFICRRAPHVNNSTGRDLPRLARDGRTYNPAYMHPADLDALGLGGGDTVRIESAHGTIPGIAQPDPTLRRGLVSMTHAFGDLPALGADFRRHGSNTSQLTSVEEDYDRWSGIPRMSAVPVRVSRLG